MKSHIGFGRGMTGAIAVLVLSLSGGTASAQSSTTTVTSTPPPPPPTVVQTPAPQQVQVQPAPQQVQVQPAPVTSKQVVTDTHSPSFMATIAKNTFYGAVAGALVGGAIYFIDRDSMRAASIGYWAAGGALVGVGVGAIEVATREDRNERAVSQLLGGPRARRINVAFVPRLVNLHF
jgi:hypothetical protein